MITIVIPEWLLWFIAVWASFYTSMLGIKIWYGWSLTRDQKINLNGERK